MQGGMSITNLVSPALQHFSLMRYKLSFSETVVYMLNVHIPQLHFILLVSRMLKIHLNTYN